MKKTAAITLILLLIICSIPNAAALVDPPNGDTAPYYLGINNQFFNLDDYEPVSAVVVKITGVKSDGENRQTLKYKVESVLWQDIEKLPKFDLSSDVGGVKKGDRFVLFYGRHIFYWGDSFRPSASFKLDGERFVTPIKANGKAPISYILTLDELQKRLERQPSPDHSVAAPS